MNSMDFRTTMLTKLRAFEKWAWLDEMENPSEWRNDMTFVEWFEMLTEYLENEND